MAQCKCGKHGNNELDCGPDCGCGCVCDAGTDRCIYLCDCPKHDEIWEVSGMVVAPGDAGPLDLDATVKLCANGIRMAALASALGRHVKATLYVPAGRFTETLNTRETGSLSEVLEACGIKVERPADEY